MRTCRIVRVFVRGRGSDGESGKRTARGDSFFGLNRYIRWLQLVFVRVVKLM